MKQIKFGQLFTIENKVFQYRKTKTTYQYSYSCEQCDAKIKQHIWVGNHYEYIYKCMKNLPICEFRGYFKRIK